MARPPEDWSQNELKRLETGAKLKASGGDREIAWSANRIGKTDGSIAGFGALQEASKRTYRSRPVAAGQCVSLRRIALIAALNSRRGLAYSSMILVRSSPFGGVLAAVGLAGVVPWSGALDFPMRRAFRPELRTDGRPHA